MKQLFFTGFLQVFFVAANTYLISRYFLVGVAVCTFLISFIWTYNVSRKDGKVSFQSLKDRMIYSVGAMCGGLSGLIFIEKILCKL
jgi:O-antigen/teichoic acid export membrane protein